MKLIDLVGKRFGRLVVISSNHSAKGQRWWNCLCDCGQSIVASSSVLRYGNTKSCGCFRRDLAAQRFTRHGMKNSRAYSVWEGMKTRCNNQNRSDYMNYGGRGIALCNRWQFFENFFADMGEPPPGMEIERIDNEKGYEPGNCEWADKIKQANNRRNNRLFNIDGKTYTLGELSRMHKIKYLVLWKRINRGWPIEKAIGLDIQHTTGVRF